MSLYILIRKNEGEKPKPNILKFIAEEETLEREKERLKNPNLKSYIIYKLEKVFQCDTLKTKIKGKRLLRKRLIWDKKFYE